MELSPAVVNGRTIPDIIRHWAVKFPDKEVFVFYSDAGRRSITCGNLHELSGKFASTLQRLGLRKGDVVCTTLTNSIERVVTDFGIMTAGCIATTLQALLSDGTDMMHVINVCKCRLLIADPTMPRGAWDMLKGHLGNVKNGRVQTDKAPSLEMVLFVSVVKDEQFLEKLLQEEEPEAVDIHPEDNALCWATSGSTGFSKLVPHTHERLILMSKTYKTVFNIGPKDVLHSDRPLGWAGGWPHIFINGCNTQVLTDTRGSVSDPCKLIWNAIGKERCTISALTVPVMKSLQERDDLVKMPLLDSIIATGQPFRPHFMEAVGKLCKVVLPSYGSTEMGYITSAVCTEKEHFLYYLAGYVTDIVTVKIVDDQLQEVAAGKDGHMLIKGPVVFTEYFHNLEETKAAFTDDGWMKTNDVGHFDEKGRLFVEGRRSDVIMHGEYIIYPSWVEKKLSECPYVKEVVVVGVPDEDMSFAVCACVLARDSSVSSELLKEYCDPMFIGTPHQQMSACPRYYLIIERFPLLPSGKQDRRALAGLAAKLLNIA